MFQNHKFSVTIVAILILAFDGMVLNAYDMQGFLVIWSINLENKERVVPPKSDEAHSTRSANRAQHRG